MMILRITLSAATALYISLSLVGVSLFSLRLCYCDIPQELYFYMSAFLRSVTIALSVLMVVMTAPSQPGLAHQKIYGQSKI